MTALGIASIPAIAVICLFVGLGVKKSPLNDKWIPIACGSVGGTLGIAGMFVMADFPATDIITAAAVGIVSGLAATGAHQIGKQLGGG